MARRRKRRERRRLVVPKSCPDEGRTPDGASTVPLAATLVGLLSRRH